MDEMVVDILISCSGDSRDQNMLDELVTQLRASDRNLRIWHARMVQPGADTIASTRERLSTARGILLLISADYLASDDLMAEAEVALDRQHEGEALVFPILLRACNWHSRWPNLSILPADHNPLGAAANRDSAWNQIVQRILRDLDQQRTPHALNAEAADATADGIPSNESVLLDRWRGQTPTTQPERDALDVLLQALWLLQRQSDPVARFVTARYFLSVLDAGNVSTATFSSVESKECMLDTRAYLHRQTANDAAAQDGERIFKTWGTLSALRAEAHRDWIGAARQADERFRHRAAIDLGAEARLASEIESLTTLGDASPFVAEASWRAKSQVNPIRLLAVAALCVSLVFALLAAPRASAYALPSIFFGVGLALYFLYRRLLHDASRVKAEQLLLERTASYQTVTARLRAAHQAEFGQFQERVDIVKRVLLAAGYDCPEPASPAVVATQLAYTVVAEERKLEALRLSHPEVFKEPCPWFTSTETLAVNSSSSQEPRYDGSHIPS